MLIKEEKKGKKRSKKRTKSQVVVDLGTSEIKILYVLGKGVVKHMLMGSEFLSMPYSSMDKMSRSNFGNPERNAWVRLKEEDEECHLVGFAAKTNLAFTSIKNLKRETLDYKILAVIGAIVKKENLTNVDLSLSILLPLEEYELSDDYRERLEKNLSSFYFQDSLIETNVEKIQTSPEGFGLVLHKSRTDKYFSDKNILFIMQGFRNTTCLTFAQGTFDKTQSQSGDYGFYILLNALTKNHPQLDKDKVYRAIDVNLSGIKESAKESTEKFGYSEFGAEVDFSSLSKDRQEFLDMNNSFNEALSKYSNLMERWLNEMIKDSNSIDEVVFSGGTSDLMSDKIKQYFQDVSGNIQVSTSSAGEELKKYLLWNDMPGLNKFFKGNYALRFADAWGYFVQFANYDLDKVLDPKTGKLKSDKTKILEKV